MTISPEQIAHDLAIVYLHNRYGAEVSGSFEVHTYGDDVSGSGEVETERLPDIDSTYETKVPTGEKRFFGLIDKKELVDTGEYRIDEVFLEMIHDYRAAYARILALISDVRIGPA